ncbi:MAG: DUF1697 domain-containing protein [Bacteroidetes bacterium]|nr:DUF1697 domain-containing protein [Bacteroidota bacterium]
MKTNRYCAFLRGVNVKGTNMKMTDVCAVFASAGITRVSSVLASGNILFSSSKNKSDLKAQLEKLLSAYFKYEAFLFIKDKEELATLLSKNPFIPDEEFHIYGFVGVAGIEKTLMEEFEKIKITNGEEAKIVANHFYWKVQKGNTLDSAFGKILGNKNLKASFTSRNLNTLEKILKKM